MIRPAFGAIPLGTNTTKRTMSPIELIPVVREIQILHHEHDQRICQKYQQIYQRKTKKRMYQGNRIQTNHGQTHHQRNLIFQIIAIPVNQ